MLLLHFLSKLGLNRSLCHFVDSWIPLDVLGSLDFYGQTAKEHFDATLVVPNSVLTSRKCSGSGCGCLHC